MCKPKLFLLLFATISLIIIACRHSNDAFWNEVADYFSKPSRTKEEIFSKLSPNAVQAIIRKPVADSAELIVDLFRNFKDNHNYNVDRSDDTIHISFNPNAEIAGGPFFDIIRKDSFWQVTDIRFGK